MPPPSTSSSSSSSSSAVRRAPTTRVAFVLIDGVGDSSLAAFGRQTPLQHARLPRLDGLCGQGAAGLFDSVEPGLACGSDTAHLSILGYEPRRFYRGRGAFEAMGAGLAMRAGDIAFKCNFATLGEGAESGLVVRRRCDRDFHAWGPPLCEALSGLAVPGFPDVEVAVQYATEHRCGVRLRGPGLTDLVSGTDPLKDGLPLRTCAPTVAGDADAEYTSRVVNAVSALFSRVLTAHALNRARHARGLAVASAVLFRGAGVRLEVPSFHERHGLRACMIAPTCIIGGVGQSLEMDVLPCKGATGDYRTDLLAKARRCVEALAPTAAAAAGAAAAAAGGGDVKDGGAAYDFCFVHVKAVDDAGHDKNADLKVHWLERCDAMVGAIIDGLASQLPAGERAVVVVTGDHSTPVLTGDHSCEAVPVVVAEVPAAHAGRPAPRSELLDAWVAAGAGAASSAPPLTFDEISCAGPRAILGRFPGRELMPLIRRVVESP